MPEFKHIQRILFENPQGRAVKGGKHSVGSARSKELRMSRVWTPLVNRIGSAIRPASRCRVSVSVELESDRR